jgi:hypothetical protein
MRPVYYTIDETVAAINFCLDFSTIKTNVKRGFTPERLQACKANVPVAT